MTDANAYRAALAIAPPRVEDAMLSADANFYGLLIVALLEHGSPLTLEQVAMRFERAGVAPAHEALASLKRCKPARAPVYRDGEHYALDPHDDEVGLWLFRLGLRGPRFTPPQVVKPVSLHSRGHSWSARTGGLASARGRVERARLQRSCAHHSVYTKSVFDWDPRKAAANTEKHGVTFEAALTVFQDPVALDGLDLAHSAVEARRLRLGRAADGRVLMVAYTLRRGSDDAEKVRLISARRASRRERAAYDAQD